MVSGIGSMLSKIGKALGWINISVEFCFWNIWHTILYSLFFILYSLGLGDQIKALVL